jgi:NTE family protein
MGRRTALILSGGGAKGAFQAAAERYAREVKGYRWDIIAGVSVGALNGLMLAMGKHRRLLEIWNSVTPGQVYTGGFNLWSTIKLLFGAKSFYGNEPLYRMILRELEPEKIRGELRIGAVSLVTGQYVQFTGKEPHLAEAVLASTVIPVVWTPVDVSPVLQAMVDGGVRNISPIGDVLAFDPDELVIIGCEPEDPGPLEEPPPNILKIGVRTLDLMINELFMSDLREFLRINALVREAAAQNLILHNPTGGQPLREYDYKLILPDRPLDDTLDFSQAAIQRSLAAGEEKARQVLGG